jgi:hypothetical protein
VTQTAMDISDIVGIVDRCNFPGKKLRVGEMGEGYFVQIEYEERDVVTGEMALQRGRKWYVSPFATMSEIVQTCFAACLASAEHQVREHFTYRPEHEERPRAIFGPHFHSNVLYLICGKRVNYDARDNPE